jgi:hypothetical protein
MRRPVWFVRGWGIACEYVMSLGIGKTFTRLVWFLIPGLIPELIPWSTPIYPHNTGFYYLPNPNLLVGR